MPSRRRSTHKRINKSVRRVKKSAKKSRKSIAKRVNSRKKYRKRSANFSFYGNKDIDPMKEVEVPQNIINELNDIGHCDSNILSFAYNKFYRNFSGHDNLEKQFIEILKYRDAIWKSVVICKRQLGHDGSFISGAWKTKQKDREKMILSEYFIIDNQRYLISSFNQYKEGKIFEPLSNTSRCFYNNEDKNDDTMYLIDPKIDSTKSKIALEKNDLEKNKFAYVWNNIEILLQYMYAIIRIIKKDNTNSTDKEKNTYISEMENIIIKNHGNNSDIPYKNPNYCEVEMWMKYIKKRDEVKKETEAYYRRKQGIGHEGIGMVGGFGGF
jgi:hypothetical protein